MKTGYIYVLSSHSRRLYIGVTSNLEVRVLEHKQGVIEGFTEAYKINQLVYYEAFPDRLSAIAREKRLKGWTRAKKAGLILQKNPDGTTSISAKGQHRSFDCGSGKL